MLTLFPFALVAAGLASTDGSDRGALEVIAVIAGPFILLSAISAAGSLILARMSSRESPEQSAPPGLQAPLYKNTDAASASRSRTRPGVDA
jgi:hypothetical protein